MNPSVEALENQYFLLRESLSTLMAQGATTDQLAQLRTAIAKSRDNYWLATRRIMHDDDPEVQALVSKMNSAQLSLDAAIQHLGDVAKVVTVDCESGGDRYATRRQSCAHLAMGRCVEWDWFPEFHAETLPIRPIRRSSDIRLERSPCTKRRVSTDAHTRHRKSCGRPPLHALPLLG